MHSRGDFLTPDLAQSEIVVRPPRQGSSYGEPSPPEDLHVVERFTRTDGDTLLYQFTVESSDFEAPYTGKYPWPQTRHKLYEFACLEGNYAMGNILREARLQEREVSTTTPRTRSPTPP